MDDSQVPGPSKKKKPQLRLTRDQKRSLISAIKEQTVIWNLRSKFHKDRNALSAAWKSVSKKTSIPVLKCKSIWKSLRQTNVRKQKPKHGKGGQGLEESADDTDTEGHVSDSGTTAEDDQGWEFSQDLGFLETYEDENPLVSTPLNIQDDTEMSQLGSNETDVEVISLCSPPTPSTSNTMDSSQSNYPWIERDLGKKRTIAEQLGSLSSTIEDYFKRGSERAQDIEISQTSTESWSRYASFYSYLDKLIQKLPESVVEDLQVEMINMVHVRIKEEGSKDFIVYHVGDNTSE